MRTPRQTPARLKSCFDPFLRHPAAPPVSREARWHERLDGARRYTAVTNADDRPTGRTSRHPEMAGPGHRRAWAAISAWSGELARAGQRRRRPITRSTRLTSIRPPKGVPPRRAAALCSSVELTTVEEQSQVQSRRVRMAMASRSFVYGRPEGMTIEHCVLSAAFDREADHVPRSLRASRIANVRANRSNGSIPSGCDGFGMPQSPAALASGRRLGVPALVVAVRGVRGYPACVQCARATTMRAITAGYRSALDALARRARARCLDAVRKLFGRRVHPRALRARRLSAA